MADVKRDVNGPFLRVLVVMRWRRICFRKQGKGIKTYWSYVQFFRQGQRCGGVDSDTKGPVSGESYQPRASCLVLLLFLLTTSLHYFVVVPPARLLFPFLYVRISVHSSYFFTSALFHLVWAPVLSRSPFPFRLQVIVMCVSLRCVALDVLCVRFRSCLLS